VVGAEVVERVRLTPPQADEAERLCNELLNPTIHPATFAKADRDAEAIGECRCRAQGGVRREVGSLSDSSP
jgi:hypothetical protein